MNAFKKLLCEFHDLEQREMGVPNSPFMLTF